MAWANAVNATQTGVQTINAGVWTGSTLTQHNLLVGGASSAITSVAPSATAGVAFVSAGASADPAPGIVVVPGGGTGADTFTAYAPIMAGTTSTGVFQQATTGFSTSGFVLTSTGSSSLPTWQAAAGGTSSLSWTTNATTTIAMTAGNGYITTATSAIAVSLPTSAAGVGTALGISVNGSGGAATITMGTGQTIQIGSQTFSSSVASTALGDTLVLINTVAASGSAGSWVAISPVGNWSGS